MSRQWQMVVFALLGWLAISAARGRGLTPFVVTVGVLMVSQYWLGPVLIWLTNRPRVPTWSSSAAAGLEILPADIRPFFETRTVRWSTSASRWLRYCAKKL